MMDNKHEGLREQALEEGARGQEGAEDGLTGVARAAAKLLVLAVASSSSPAAEQLAASALRRS